MPWKAENCLVSEFQHNPQRASLRKNKKDRLFGGFKRNDYLCTR